MKLNPINILSLVILLILTTVIASLFWNTSRYLNTMQNDQLNHSSKLAKAAANDISELLTEDRQRVSSFTQRNDTLINQLIANTDDDDIVETLNNLSERQLPFSFAFTLADRHGVPMLEDIEGLISGLCKKDIQGFSRHQDKPTKHRLPKTFIHPQAFHYHYDIMTWLDENVFFISFNAERLVALLGRYQLKDHTLLLIHNQKTGLIEISPAGLRDQISRSPRLSDAELSRINFRHPIAGTYWDLVVIPKLNINEELIQQQWRNTTLWAIGLFLLVALFLFLLRDGHNNDPI